MSLEAENKYPEMFEQCFEVWCPKGWIPMVEELCDRVFEIDPNVKVQQIKEKFGGLRFYYQGSLYDEGKAVEYLVKEAEMLSFSTCQNCGIVDTNKVETEALKSWIITLCPDCRKEMENASNV